MIVFAENITSRLWYTLNFVLNEQLGLAFSVTSDFEAFCLAKAPKINYSPQSSSGDFQLLPEGLLFEDGLRNNKPIFSKIDSFPVIFKNENGDLNFDVFSAVFWFLSRYEEYQNFQPDSHNRFPATESFAFKNQLLNRPLVDEWILYFSNQIKIKYPDIEFKKNKFCSITTIDVDSPWCYKNKGFYRNTGGIFRDLLKGNSIDAWLRIKVLLTIESDPWYNFDWIMQLAERNSQKLLFFIHVGDFGKFDKTVNYNSKAFISFVKKIASKVNVGLHPSYNAAQNKKIFQVELNRLSGITNKKIVKSRQHYLVFSTAQYYPQLIELGITDDYSMGFADKAGFRAGTSRPFYFFDLHKNQETKLLIHPFAVMDRTLNSYQNQSVNEAVETVKSLIENVKKVEGTFVSLWHNESLSNINEWKGWREGFQEIIEFLAERE